MSKRAVRIGIDLYGPSDNESVRQKYAEGGGARGLALGGIASVMSATGWC